MRDGCNDLLHRNFQRVADAQEGHHIDGLAGFHSLPVPDTKSVRNHIFLRPLMSGPSGTNLVP